MQTRIKRNESFKWTLSFYLCQDIGNIFAFLIDKFYQRERNLLWIIYIYIYQGNSLSKRVSRSRNVTKQSATNESDRVSICSCNQVCSLPFPRLSIAPRPKNRPFSFIFSIPFHPPPILQLVSCISANRLTGDFGLIETDLPRFSWKPWRRERNRIGTACWIPLEKSPRFNYRF